MTGGAQGRTGTRFARWLTKRVQSATGSNTKLSLFFYILFLSTYPTFFFICYLVSLVHKDIHGLGADLGTQDSVLSPPSYWTELGIEPGTWKTSQAPLHPTGPVPQPTEDEQPQGHCNFFLTRMH